MLFNFNPTQFLIELLYLVPVILISLTVHEFSHAYVATKLGDPTPKNTGRLSLNPLRHIDPFGFIMLILVRFGWAKPVQVSPMYFENPKKGMMLTAIAGPVSNFILAFISSFLASFTIFIYIKIGTFYDVMLVIFTFFRLLAMINIGLAIFNLIPVYPLDGSRILNYFLPNAVNNFFNKYGVYIQIAFILLVIFTNFIGNFIYMVETSVFDLFTSLWYFVFGIS